MPDDFKFLFFLFLLCAIPFGYFALTEQPLPQSREWSRDPHLNYFYDRLHSGDNPRVVFFGTSKTMNNIDAHLLNRGEDSPLVLNLGINWFGFGIQATLIELWLNEKSPDTVVLEVPYLLRYPLHPNFDKTARPAQLSELIRHAPWKAASPVLSFAPSLLYQIMASKVVNSKEWMDKKRKTKSGHVEIELDEEQMNEIRSFNQKQLTMGMIRLRDSEGLRKIYRDFHYQAHRAFLQRISEVCKKNDVEFVLLALPRIRLNELPPSLKKEYESLGSLVIPPAELVQKVGYWRDQSHMTPEGAKELTRWLAPLVLK